MKIDARGVFHFPILKNKAQQITNRSNRFYFDAAIPMNETPSENETPLVLWPAGTGDISYAFKLAHNIDKNISVFVLPWPSPDHKTPATLEIITNAIIPHIMHVRPNDPCAIAAYSGGGFLAVEISKQLTNTGYPVSFVGLIDTYSILIAPLSETETFLNALKDKIPNLKFDDSVWYDRVRRLTLNDAIEEIQSTNVDVDSNNTDIEWEALLSKNRSNYQNICVAYQIDLRSVSRCIYSKPQILMTTNLNTWNT